VPAISAIACAVALLMSGCSSDVMFPAVHDMPAARVDTTMTPDQVKQATDELNCERDHLSTGAQAAAQSKPADVQRASSCGQAVVTPAVATQPANAYAGRN
jgi:outer membrane murein-binding lipoprotein Lpp